MLLTGLKRAVVTIEAVDTAAATTVETRRVDSARRSWSLTVEPDVNYRAQEWMLILFPCDQKLAESQFSPTHASTKRR